MRIIVLFVTLMVLLGLNPNSYCFAISYYNCTNDNYPRVAQAENTLFNKTYEKENIGLRLNRIERKLFNSTNNSATLSDRMDIISNTLNSSRYSFIPVQELKLMERNFLGKIYSADTIPNRIRRLEQTAWGAAQNGNLLSRFNNLHSLMQNNYNTYPAYYNQNTNVGNLLKNVFGGISTITGYTPPVYIPPQEGYRNYYDYNNFYGNNNGFHNNSHYFNTMNGVHILN